MFIEDTWRKTMEKIFYIDPEIVKVHWKKRRRCTANSTECWYSFNDKHESKIIVEFQIGSLYILSLLMVHVIAFFFPGNEIVVDFIFHF